MPTPISRLLPILGAVLASALSAQSPCFDLAIGTDLNMGDDQIVQGLSLGFTFNYNGAGYTSVCLDSNGSIYLGATTTAFADYSPTEAELLASPQPRLCGLWTDFQANATGSGHIFFNAVPAGGGNPAYALFTWNNVFEFGRTTPISVQVKLDANNVVTITYGATGAIGGTLNTTVIIGASPGLGAVSNPVSFATRPVLIALNNFADVRTVPNTPAGFKMSWGPTNPGYVAVDVPCTPNTLPGPARVDVLGVGCPIGASTKPSVYEEFNTSNPTIDVSGMDFTFLPNGQGGYIVVPGIAGPAFTGTTIALNAGDDTTHPVALPFAFPHAFSAVNNVVVSSNGFLTLGTVNPGSGCCSGTAAGLLSGESRIAAWWSDLNAGTSGTGEVYADLDPVSGDFVVTWSGIAEYVNTGTNTFQIALSPSGSFKIRLTSVTRATHDYLIGYSYGHGATANPTDFSAISAFDTGALTSIDPLVLVAAPGSLPRIGTTLTLDLSNISATPFGNVALLIIGFTELNPGVDLGIPLNAPGCTAFLLPGASDLQYLNITLGAPTTSFALPVPSNVALIGAVGIAEAVSDDTGANGFGWKFSNGLRLTVGA